MWWLIGNVVPHEGKVVAHGDHGGSGERGGSLGMCLLMKQVAWLIVNVVCGGPWGMRWLMKQVMAYGECGGSWGMWSLMDTEVDHGECGG